MIQISLYAYNERNQMIYVKEYDARKKVLTLTGNRKLAKQYKTVQGAKSSSGSIFLNYLNDVDGFNYIFEVGQFVK